MTNSSAHNQVLINLGFTFVKSFFLLLSIWLADLLLSASTMGLLLLFRRQGVLWGNLLQLGFSQSLQKFYTSDPNRSSRITLWNSQNRWIFLVNSVVVVTSGLLGVYISESFFGLSDEILGLAFGVYVAGVAIGYIACSSWMVEFRLVHANMIDWLNGSLIFLVCVFVGAKISGVNIFFCLRPLR